MFMDVIWMYCGLPWKKLDVPKVYKLMLMLGTQF